MSLCVVQFHGFKDNSNNWIIKEFSLVGKDTLLNYLFESPYKKEFIKDQKTIRWLENYYHKIKWESGTRVFKKNEIYKLLNNFQTVYTKGNEKKSFLNKFHDNVVDIDYINDLHLNNFTDSYKKCICGYKNCCSSCICIIPEHQCRKYNRYNIKNKKMYNDVICAYKSAFYYYNLLSSFNNKL